MKVVLLLLVELLALSTANKLMKEFEVKEDLEVGNNFDMEKQTEQDEDKRGNEDYYSAPDLEDYPETHYDNPVSQQVCSVGSSRYRDLYTIGSTPKKTISGFNLPFYIQITDDGRVFLTEYGTTKVHILDQAGNKINKFSIPKGNPTGIYVKNNLVFVTNHKKEIYTFDANTCKLLGVKYAHEPVGIAVDEDNRMYVTEWRTGIIQVFHSDGRQSHTLSIPGTGARYLRKIQFDKKGDLYVPAYLQSSIYVFSKCGDIRKKIKVPGVRSAEGLFIDSKDRIYLTDRAYSGKVYIMNKNGRILKTLTGFHGPSDVAVAPDGTIWVVDFLGKKIHHF